MAEHITGVDHLLVDSDDLEADRAVWQRLGFTMTPRGRHPQWGTGNYCAMMGQGYLELIGVVDPDEFAANAARRGSRRQGKGLSAIALATDDAQGAKTELTAAGVASDGPKNLSRLLEAEDGTSEPRFDILHLPGEASPAIPMFLCGHRTPHLVRRPGWTEHPNGARALTSIAVPVDDPPAHVDAYAKLLGLGAVTLTDDILTLRVGSSAVILARPGDLATQYPDLLPEPGEGPCPGVVTLAVKDPGLTAEYLSGAKVPIMRDRQSVMVAAEDACGIAMVFEKA
jgi:hypothetical protein